MYIDKIFYAIFVHVEEITVFFRKIDVSTQKKNTPSVSNTERVVFS